MRAWATAQRRRCVGDCIPCIDNFRSECPSWLINASFMQDFEMFVGGGRSYLLSPLPSCGHPPTIEWHLQSWKVSWQDIHTHAEAEQHSDRTLVCGSGHAPLDTNGDTSTRIDAQC